MNNQPAYSVEREFDIPLEILWAAWTDPDALQFGITKSHVLGT